MPATIDRATDNTRTQPVSSWPASYGTAERIEYPAESTHARPEPNEVPQPATTTVRVVVPSDDHGEAQVDLTGKVVVRGERFRVEFEEDVVHVVHPRWSLAGAGSTLAEAFVDLLVDARELAHVMADFDPATLDEDASALRNFVLAFFATEER